MYLIRTLPCIWIARLQTNKWEQSVKGGTCLFVLQEVLLHAVAELLSQCCAVKQVMRLYCRKSRYTQVQLQCSRRVAAGSWWTAQPMLCCMGVMCSSWGRFGLTDNTALLQHYLRFLHMRASDFFISSMGKSFRIWSYLSITLCLNK